MRTVKREVWEDCPEWFDCPTTHLDSHTCEGCERYQMHLADKRRREGWV